MQIMWEPKEIPIIVLTVLIIASLDYEGAQNLILIVQALRLGLPIFG